MEPVIPSASIPEERAHSGAEFVKWLVANPLPKGSARTPEALDEQIAREREGWE